MSDAADHAHIDPLMHVAQPDHPDQVANARAEAGRAIRDIGHSRIPVYDGSLDNVVGIFYVKDLMRWMAGEGARVGGKPFDLKNIVRPALFVPETKTVRELLRELIRRNVHIAMVADEYGGTAGLVTIEDIVEQIVGEIYDETDDAPPRPEVETLADGSVRVAGEMLLEPAAEALGLASIADHQDVDTVGGLVLKQLGRQPRTGDAVVIERYRVVVLAAKGFRITQLHFQPLPEEGASDDESGRVASLLPAGLDPSLLPVALASHDEPAPPAREEG